MTTEATLPAPALAPTEPPATDDSGAAKGAAQATGPDDNKPMSVYAIAGIAAFVSVIVSVSAMAGYHALFAQKQKIGMVDIAGILETSEVVFTEMLSRGRVSDVDRQAAYDLVRETGPKLDAAIAELQHTCDCVLMTKAAVVGAGAIDYTPQVKAKLGIDKVDVKALQARIRDVMQGKKKEGQE